METVIVHGDIMRLQSDEDKQEALRKLPRLRTKAEKLIEDCPTCALEQARVDQAHALGFTSELQEVDLGNGQRVPAKILVEAYLDSQRQEQANAAAAKVINAANQKSSKNTNS